MHIVPAWFNMALSGGTCAEEPQEVSRSREPAQACAKAQAMTAGSHGWRLLGWSSLQAHENDAKRVLG
jgi:hypothetical protein